MKSLEQDLLKELLNYDPETGVFTWAVDRGNVKAGSIAGCLFMQGYIGISINKSSYKAHRLAWIYMYGVIPKGLTVDHKNGNKSDNSLDNLRLATTAQQNQNAKIYASNTSGFVGVVWHKQSNKWRAYITVNKQTKHLGSFNTPEAANDARIKAKAELHLFNPIQRTS